MMSSVGRHFLSSLLAGCCATATLPSTTAPTTSSAGLDIAFRNDLAACVSFTLQRTEALGNVLLLHATMLVAQGLDACGCKSAVLGYRVKRVDRPASNLDVVGRINTLLRQLPDESVVMVLATDASMFKAASGVSVQVTCTDAD